MTNERSSETRPDGTPHGTGAEGFEIVDLGREAYADSLRRMRETVASIRADGSDGKVFLVEHESVYTAGRALRESELPDFVVPIERGGRITWHGPGQLVVYPIVRLPSRDLRRWLRALEQFGVELCARFGLDAEPSVDGTGVFVDGRKIASIGVAVRHWISMHGISINVATGEEPWQRIRPCGLAPEIMSDLSTVTGRAVRLDEARAAARACLGTLRSGC